jgi:chromosome segregation ATPase
MPPIQTGNFSVVIAALEKSAEKLINQDKAEAQNTILDISSEIQFLAEISQNKESEYKKTQQKITEEISEIIQKEGVIRESYLNIQKDIDVLNVEISKEKTNKEDILATINSLQIQLINTENELRAHQAKLNELNDASASSIFRSILSLGLDRAIMGITTLVNDDTGRIKSLNEELSKYKNAIHQDDEKIKNAENILNYLNEKKRSSEALVAELSNREIDLQKHEKSCRQRLSYFTNVALFYGKLLIMSQEVEHRINDVIDIVDELNDTTPSIIDFDSSGKDLISLRQSLEKFDQLLSNEPVGEIN